MANCKFKLNDGNSIPGLGFGVFMVPNDGPTYQAVLTALKTGAGSAQTTERDTWGTYTQTNGGKFGYVTQIDGTILYAFVDEAHKDAVSAFAKAIGY